MQATDETCTSTDADCAKRQRTQQKVNKLSDVMKVARGSGGVVVLVIAGTEKCYFL